MYGFKPVCVLSPTLRPSGLINDFPHYITSETFDARMYSFMHLESTRNNKSFSTCITSVSLLRYSFMHAEVTVIIGADPGFKKGGGESNIFDVACLK